MPWVPSKLGRWLVVHMPKAKRRLGADWNKLQQPTNVQVGWLLAHCGLLQQLVLLLRGWPLRRRLLLLLAWWLGLWRLERRRLPNRDRQTTEQLLLLVLAPGWLLLLLPQVLLVDVQKSRLLSLGLLHGPLQLLLQKSRCWWQLLPAR